MTRRRWFGLALLVVFVWLAVCGFLLLRAASDLRAARDLAQDARDRLDPSTVADGSALPDLREARERFDAAADRTEHPILAPMRLLPVVGRQVRSVHALSTAAAEVTASGTKALERVQQTLAAPNDTPGQRLQQVRELTSVITVAAREVAGVDDLGPRRGLVGPVRDAYNELAEKLTDVRATLDDAAAGARAGLQLLTGPRRYLLVAANPAEMRAGSGMWLSGGTLTTAEGSFDLDGVAPLYEQADPPNGAAPITDRDMAALWEEAWHPNWDWRGLMTSPRLPASAELGRRMWVAAGKPAVDGLLIVDPVGLAAVVEATGPVEVDGRTFDADDIVPYLLNEQYTNDDLDVRREALGDLSEAVFDALDGGSWSPETLAAELADAVRGRHLLAWSADEEEQRGWRAAGMSGELSSDSLLVSVLNRGGNKLDWFLRTDARLTTEAAGPGTDVTVGITLRNDVPDGQPRYVTGPPPTGDWPPGTYLGVVAVNVPGDARDIRVDGRPVVVSGRDGPSRVVAVEVRLDRGASTTVDVRFRLPRRHGRIVVEPSARVPAMTWHYGARRWQDTDARTAKF